MHSLNYKPLANIPPHTVVEPENSLDNAAAQADVVTASADRVALPGQQAKRSLRPARNEHPGLPPETDSMHSRNSPPPSSFSVPSYCYHHIYTNLLLGSRRQSLRTTAPPKAATATLNSSRSQPNLRSSLNSAYPTPDRSDTSRATKKSARGQDDRKSHVKSSASKLVSPAPSESPPPPPLPIIYDTIEVMLAPPADLDVKNNNSPSKRKNNRAPARRSKRIKLDNDNEDSMPDSELPPAKETNPLDN